MASTLPLTGDGDISINSTTPADGKIKLTNSGTGAGKALTIESSNAGSGDTNGGNIILTPGINSGLGSNGKVGINTTSPLALLHNNGDFITKGPYFDVRAFGATPLQLRGGAWWNDGDIVAATNRITAPSQSPNPGRFTDAQGGDSLWITNGVNLGRYTIVSVDISGNYVTVGAGLFTQDQTNVNWYVTTGVEDSSPAFQDALNAAAASVGNLQSNGGVVYVPKGRYRITSKLTIPLGVSLVGAGREGTMIIADFAEKTGAATFVNGSNSVTGITGSLAQYDYVKVAAHDFTALARVESIAGNTATLHVNYYGESGSGYKTVTPVIECLTNNATIRDIKIVSAQMKEHIGIHFFHSGDNRLDTITVEYMHVGIYLNYSYTEGRKVIVDNCRTGIQFGNPGIPDWCTCNYFYGGQVGNCSEYGVRFVKAWGNLIYGMDIGYNIGPDMVAPVSLEGGGDPLGNNTLIGCFSENNDPCIIKINSPGNNIIGYNLNSGLMFVEYTGTGSKDDMITGGAFTGSTPTRYRVEIDGTAPDTFRWYDQTGPIKKFADGGGNTIVTAPGHGLAPGSYTITIFGTTNYDGQYTANYMNNDTFTINIAWSADDGKGYWKTATPAGQNVPIKAYKAGSIQSVADNGSGHARIYSPSHGLSGNAVIIAGTADYNGTYTVTFIDTDHFDISATYTTSQTGSWQIAVQSVADNGSGHARIYSPSHGLSTGNVVIIAGTANYNGTYTVTVIDADHFDISAAYVTSQTGSWRITNPLNNGVTISFASVTGHSTADSWFSAGRTIYDLSGITTGTMLSGNFESTPTGNSRDMRLLSSNLGVGTASPANKLDVAGSTAIGSGYAGTAAPADGLIVAGNAGIGITTPDTSLHVHNSLNNGPQIMLSAPSGGTPGIAFRPYRLVGSLGTDPQALICATDNSWSADLHFSTKVPGGCNNPLAERMTIKNDGAVGIGTTSPVAKLDVNGLVHITGSYCKDAINITGTGVQGICVGGNSAARLAVFGLNTIISNNYQYNSPLPLQDDPTHSSWLMMLGNQSGYDALTVSRSPAGSTALSEFFRVANNGNVGIGTTSPGSLLELRKDVQGDKGDIGPILTLNNKSISGNTAIYMSGYDVHNDPPASAIKALDSNYSAHITFSTKVPGASGNALTERVRIQNDGAVGINNTNPGEKLDVTGNIKGSGAVIIPAVRPVTDSTTALQIQNAAGTTSIVNVDTTNARVGIGNTPSEKLEVTGNIKGSGAVIIPAVKPATDSTTALQLQKANGTSVVTVDTTNSRVGIGTTPSQALDVVGTIKDSVALITPVVKPATDGTTALQLQNAAGTTSVVTVDTTNQRVGIGATPPSKLHVEGSVGVKVVTKTGNYTAADETVILVNTGAATITLPTASTVTGRTYYIKKTSGTAGNITINGNGAMIDGVATKTLTAQYQGMQIVCDGTAWFIIALK